MVIGDRREIFGILQQNWKLISNVILISKLQTLSVTIGNQADKMYRKNLWTKSQYSQSQIKMKLLACVSSLKPSERQTWQYQYFIDVKKKFLIDRNCEQWTSLPNIKVENRQPRSRATTSSDNFKTLNTFSCPPTPGRLSVAHKWLEY